MITSTLSLSLFPKDRRRVEDYHRANMTKSELKDYVDESNAFKALVMQNTHQS